MAVIYLVFNEGYAATAGTSWMRTDLCLEALRLARMLAALAPDDAEVHGLQALMELQASRFHARTSPSGEPVLLEDQDRAPVGPPADPPRAGRAVTRRVVRSVGGRLHRAGRDRRLSRPGPAGRRHGLGADRVALRPAVLGRRQPRRSRSTARVAHGRAFGPDAGLAVLDAVADAAGTSYTWHAVRGDLLSRDGRPAEASQEFRTAASLTRNEAERLLLLRRADSG